MKPQTGVAIHAMPLVRQDRTSMPQSKPSMKVDSRSAAAGFSSEAAA